MNSLEGKFRSFLVLQPRDGNYATLIAFFRQNDVLGTAVRAASAWSAEMHVPVSGSGPVVVTAVWDSADAYAAWRSHPARAAWPPIEDVTEASTPGSVIGSGVYAIALSAARD